MILTVFTILTIATAALAQIPPNKFVYQSVSDSFVNEPINLKIQGAYFEPETPKAAIARLAKENNFKWPEYLSRLAFFESSYNPKAINKNKNGSIDRGIFQWNDKAHPEISDKCAFNIECSTLATMKAINEGHQGWWMADSKAKHK